MLWRDGGNQVYFFFLRRTRMKGLRMDSLEKGRVMNEKKV